MLTIITALYHEAAPIIDYFSLKKEGNLYQNGAIRLLITKSGKIKSAIHTALLLDKSPSPVLNIGVAGSDTEKIGEGFLVEKIEDADSSYHFFPDNLIPFKKRASLTTVSRVETYYSLVDTEGSGFFEAASEYLSVDDIYLYKIVSDTPHSPKPTPEMITSLITTNIPTIEELITQIMKRKKASFSYDQSYVNEVVSRLRLTQTQTHRLRDHIIYLTLKKKTLPLLPKEEVKDKNERKKAFEKLLDCI